MSSSRINIAAEDGGLDSCLTDAKVHDAVKAVLKKIGVESLSDFVYYVKETTWEVEFEAIRDQAATPLNANGVALSRLRAAWKAGKEAIVGLERQLSLLQLRLGPHLELLVQHRLLLPHLLVGARHRTVQRSPPAPCRRKHPRPNCRSLCAPSSAHG